MKRRKIIYTIGLLIITALLLLTFQNSKIKGQKDYGQTNTDHAILVGEKDPNDQNNYDEIFSDIATAFNEAEADYETTTTIILTKDTSLDEDITIQSGQNIKVVSKDQDVVIGVTNRGYTLSIESTISLDLQSSLSFDCNVDLKTNGSIKANFEKTGDTFFLPRLEIYDSLNALGGSLNTDYFNSINVYGTINLTAGDITSSNEEENVALNIPLTLQGTNSGLVYTGGTLNTKIAGEGLVVTTNDTTTIDAPDTVMKIKAEVLTAESENNVELSSKTKGIYILDSTINYSLTSSLTLSDDLTLIALGDATITVGQNGYFNVSGGKTLNINGYLDGNSSSNTFYSIGANNLIIDGGITWEQIENGTYYFVTDSYEPGKGDAETFGRAKYSASGNTSSYPLIRVNGSDSTLNLYQNAVLQNRINTQSEGKSNNSGGAVALNGEAKDKRVNLNIIGANIRYNALPNVANSSGGAGIGAYNANIHMYSGSIDHNTVYKQAGFTEMENGQEVASTDGAGVSLIENAELIMEDGYISYNHGSSNYNSDGAGIMVRQSSNLDIKGGEVSYNFTYGYGGGICIYNSQVDISNGRIIGNRATYGGGIASSHEDSANLDDTTITLGKVGEESNLDVTSNTAFTPANPEGKATGYGGGVALGNDQLNNNQQLIVNDANIYNNTAIYGGGISAYTNGGDNGGRLYLRGGNISNNIAETSNNGNGIYVYSKGNDGINSLVYLSGSIKIDTSNNIVFADLDTLNNSQNDVISDDDWPKWENTNVIERDFNGLVHYKYQNLDVAKNNYHYLVINSDDRPNTSASAGYIFEITPYTDVTFHFNLIRPYDKGDSSTSFSIINKSNNTTVYTKNSLDSLGRRGLTGKWTPDSVQLMAGITYSIIASDDVAMKDISYSNATQTPIVVEDKLTATGAIGLITYDDSNQYSTHSTLAAYKNGEAQEDKFIIDNANYHVLAQGKAIKIVKTETDKNYIAEVVDLDVPNNKFTNLSDAISAITESSDTNFTIQILQNVNLTKEDFITIPTGKHVTITSAEGNRFTLNIPPEIEGDGSTIFTIENGASLTLSNIIYEGGASKNKEFVVVENNGTFTLESRAEINSNLAPDGLASIEIGRGKTTTEIAGIISKNEGQYGAIFIPFSEANVNITNGAQIYDNRYTGNITGLENIGEYVDIVLESGNLNLNDLTKNSNIGVIVKQGSGSINASNLANTTPIGIKLNGSYDEQTDTYANYYRNAVAVNVTDSNTYTNKFKLIAPNNPLDSLIKEEVGSDLILNMVLAVEISFSNAWNANEDKTGYIKGETVDVVSDAYDSFTDIKNIIKKLFNVDVNEDNYTNYLTVKVKEDTIIFYIDSTKQLQFSRFTEITSRASYYLNGFVQYEKSADTSNTYYGTSSYISVQNFSQKTNHINLGTVWEPNSYVFEFNAGGLSTALGEMENQTIYHNNFDDSTKYPNIDTNLYYAIGFYFKGWKVKAKTGFVQENREDLVIADGDQITPSMLSSITSQADGDTSFVFEAQWVSIFGDNNNDGFANISNVGTSSNNPFIIRDVEGLNVLADTISNDSGSYMVDEYSYYTTITVTITTETNKETGDTEEKKVVNKGYETNSYAGYYFKLADNFDNTNNSFIKVIGTIDYLGDDYFNNPDNKDPIYSDILNTQANHPFCGYFDGNKKTINVNINPTTNKDFVGLFGYTKNATITNLNIAGSVSGRVSVGGLVGLAYGGKISNIESDVEVSFTGINGGGIIGTYYIETENYRNGEVRHVINRGEVKYTPSDNDKKETEVSFGSTWTEDKLMIAYQGTRAGGIIGQSFHVQLIEAYNSGNVTARFGVGGIIGTMISQNDDISQDSVVNTAFNIGDVEATSGLGTDYQYKDDSTTIYQVNAYVGGIVGRMYGASTLSNSMNVGNVIASWRGTYDASDPNNVTFTYSATDPTLGGRGAGGIIGVTSIEIDTLLGGNKYISSVINTGKVKAWSHVGGIAGILAYSDVSYSINVGVVEADGYITYKEGNYAFTGAIVGLGIAANLSATVAFDGDLSYKTQTDSIIQAIGDNGDESVVFGYSANSSLAAKLSSSHLICQPNNSKPYGLSSTFFDTGWEWQSYDTKEIKYYYYPQLKSFSTATTIILKDNKSVSKISEEAVRLTIKDEAVTDQHKVTIILNLMNGSIRGHNSITINEDITFNYVDSENVWKAENIPYKNYQQEGKTLDLAEIEAVMSYPGYDFKGWYLDEDYTEPPFDGYISSQAVQTLYAKWVPHQYNINLTGVVKYSNGNVELSNNENLSYTIEDTRKDNVRNIILPTIKENSAYKYEYWRTTINTTEGIKTYNATSFSITEQDNGNYLVSFFINGVSSGQGTITKLQQFDFELYCSEINYDISFIYNNYTSNSNLTSLDGVTNPNLDSNNTTISFNINSADGLELASKPGYEFKGWFYEGQKVNTISEILKILNKDKIDMKDVKLEGRFEADTFKLILNLNGGTFAGATGDSVTLNINGENYIENYILERNNEGVWVIEVLYGTDITWLTKITLNHIKSPAGKTFIEMSSHIDTSEDILSKMPAYDLTVYANYKTQTYKIKLGVTSDAGTSINGLEFIELDENITIDNGTLSWENNTLYLTTEYGADLSDALKTIQNILNARSDTSYKPGGYEAKYDDKSFNYYNVKIDEKYNEISINFIYSQENFIVDFYDSLGNFIAKFETKGSQESWLIDNKIIVSELTNSLSTILAEAKYKVPTGYTKDNQYIIYVDDIAITITDAEISVVGAYTRIVIQLTAKKYSVKFETEGTEVTDTIKFTYNEPIAKLPDSNRDGYDLSGWEYNGSLLAKGTEFNEEHFSFDFDNSTEITLKARYEAATYNITYEFKADAYWAGNISSQSESVRYNDFEAIDLEEEFSDFEGYSFGSASYNNKDITNYIIDNTFLESLDQERNITITINLKIKTIYIIFNAGDGHFKFIKDDITRGFYLENYSGNITDLSDSSKHITEDNGDNSKLKYLVIEANYYQRAVDALHNRPILAGHTYSSYIAQDNNINMNTPLTNAQNIFNANYNADTYTITYIGEGITTTTTTAKYDQEITLSTPTRTGYKFEGWKIVGQTDGKLYKDKYIVKGNVVFEAEWQEKEFNLILTVEEKYRDAVLEALAKIDDSFISWPANNTFKIKFNTNLQELNRIETNNSLLIWKNDNVPYTFSTMPADKLELTAELNQREYVEITAKVKNEKTKEVIFTYHLNAFKQNNGKYKIESITEEFNRDGYSFNINSVNWYGNDIPTNLANAEFTSDTIIYAYATPDPYTIVYTTYEKGVLKTDTIIGYHDQILVDVLKNINRSRPGYESKNWTMNGIAVEDNKKITSNITVVADWTPVTYKIEFKYGDLNKTTGDFNKTTEAIEYDTVINQIPTFNELNSGKEEAYYSMKFMVGSVQWNDIFGDDLRMVALNDIQEQYPEEIRKSGNEYIITVTIELVAKNFTINFIGTNIGVSNFEEFSVTFNKESDFTDITKKISDGITTSTSSFNDIIHYKCLKFGDVTVAETYVFEDLIKLFENQYDVEVRLEYEAKKYNLVYNEHNPEFTINDKNVNLDTFAPIYSGTDDGKHYYFAGWYINGDTSQTLYNNIIPVDILLNYIQDDKVEIRPKYSPRKYGIIFYDKRGNSLDTSLPYGTKLDPNNLVDSDNLELDLVLKDNEGYYEFKGWEYNNIKYLFVDGKIDLSSLTVNGHMLFNAIWEAKEFTITYNNIDGLTNPNPSTITIETNPIELKPIAKLGYTFDGWYIGETVVTELKLKTLTDKDNIILEAKFTANTYKVSFDSAGGTVVEEQSYKYDDNSFTTLPTTEKDGYAFAGWYYGNIHIQTLEDIAKYAKDNEIKLTAVYEDNRYIIEFDYQYGELTDSNIENNEISLGYSDSFNLPGINNLNEDYQFLYWKVTINNVTTYYQAGQMISRLVTTGEVTFTAIYSYKVKLNDGVDTKFELDLVLDGTSVILPSLPDKEHYSFKGWVTKENDSNVYVAGEKYSLTKPLYAKYEPNTYTITYEIHDENNNEYHYDIVTYTYSENNQGISLKSLPTNSDLYEYDGWYLNDKKVTDINTIFGQNVTLYAKRKTNDITTTIIVNNVPNVNVYEEHLNDIKGDKANVEIKVSNTTVTVIFTTKYNETREIINNFFGSSYSVTSEGINYNLDKLNINLTTPSKNEKYELSFYTGSVKVTLYLVKGTSETTIGTLNELSINEDLINDRLNNIDKLGYEFKGWKTKGADDQYEDYQFTDDELTTALNLYAVYEAISYTISYNNTNINDQTVAFDDNQKVATLNADGQKLLGWSLKEGGPVQYSAGESINNVLIDHLTNEINLTANGNTITLYPVTREYYLTINFDKVDSSATGNMSSIKVSYSDLNGYVLPANKYELVGYTSTSWKYNNENITSISDELLIDLQEMIASKDASINLIANWEPNNYSVTYINATVTLENIYTEYTYGIGLTLLTVNDLTSRDGFTFAGWFTTSACSGDAVTAINNTEIGNKTYYAKWTPNKYYLKFEKSETIEYVDKNGNDFTFTTVNGEDFDDNFYYLEVTYGSNIPELPILKESNYIFHAWTYNNVTISEGNVYSYVSNIILNANKSKQPYTIFIDFDNGNQNVNEVTEYGASINEHLDNYSNISKTGYTLTGWYINGTSYTLEQLEQNELAITSSTTIKAIWTPNKYDLIIDGTTNEDYLTFGQDNSLEDIIDELTKDGYHLLGFTDEENGQIVKYQNSYKLEKAEDIALYPIWEANTLTIIFNNNNGSGTMKHQIVSYDQLDDFELAENTFTKRGHDFIGWLYNSDQIISFDNGKLDLTNFIAYVKEQLKNESFTIELEANWQASTYSITIW